MRIEQKATFDYEAEQPGTMSIARGFDIVANLESLEIRPHDRWSFVEGMCRGRIGQIPILCLEPYPISLDMGSCRFISGAFDGKTSQFSMLSRFNNRIGFEMYTNTMSTFAGDKGLKGLKRWCDILDQRKQKAPSSTSDPHFQLVNVEWAKNSSRNQASVLDHDVVDLLAFQLGAVKEEADRRLIQASCRLVLPLPLSFRYTSRLLVKKAAIQAGFTSVDFLPQNVALAQYFFCNNESRQEIPLTIFVSMGQSYTDIGVCQTNFINNNNQNQKKLDFVSVLGLEMGGANWTRAIFEHLKRAISNNTTLSPDLERQLYNECELAKIDLTTSQSTKISLLNDLFTLTRSVYEQITKHLVEELIESIKSCLAVHLRNGMADNMQIVLFGGPFYQKLLVDDIADTFPGSAMHVMTEPTAISNGAAQFFSVSSRLRLPIISSTRHYHYGVQVGEELCPILFPHQTLNDGKFRVSPGARTAHFLIYEGNYMRKEFNSLIAAVAVDGPSIPLIEFAEFKVEISVNQGGEICVGLFQPPQKLVLNQPLAVDDAIVTAAGGWSLRSLQHEQAITKLYFAPKRYSFSFHSTDVYFNKLCEIQTTQTPLESESVSKALFIKLKSHIVLMEQHLADAPLQRRNKIAVEENSSGITWHFRYSQAILRALGVLADTTLENFPQSWMDIMTKELEVQIKVLSLWKSHPQPVIMETSGSAAMDDPQRSSFNQLYELNRDIVLYTSEHCFRLANLEIVVSSSNQVLPQDNKDLAIYIDGLERFLLKLDAIEAHDHSLVKQYRKSIIKYCQTCLAQFDWLKRLYLD